MNYNIYQVDAFSAHLFGGNPAAIVPLQEWLADDLLQMIAAENNLSETAFFSASTQPGIDFDLRWFTPTVEADLCGHATLATAHVLWYEQGFDRNTIVFDSRSGPLTVKRCGDDLQMDFPAQPPSEMTVATSVLKALGITHCHYSGTSRRDWLLALDSEQQVAQLQPNYLALAAATDKAVIVTAPGNYCDFISRFFAPNFGINEDSVTGSAHCTLAPYWAERLQKSVLTARQISQRGGSLTCELQKDRVLISGRCATYLHGYFSL